MSSPLIKQHLSELHKKYPELRFHQNIKITEYFQLEVYDTDNVQCDVCSYSYDSDDDYEYIIKELQLDLDVNFKTICACIV